MLKLLSGAVVVSSLLELDDLHLRKLSHMAVGKRPEQKVSVPCHLDLFIGLPFSQYVAAGFSQVNE